LLAWSTPLNQQEFIPGVTGENLLDMLACGGISTRSHRNNYRKGTHRLMISPLFQFSIKDEIEAARIEATKTLTRPLATLSRRERENSILSPSGREIERGDVEEPKTSLQR
jgi:hypothetical protein